MSWQRLSDAKWAYMGEKGPEATVESLQDGRARWSARDHGGIARSWLEAARSCEVALGLRGDWEDIMVDFNQYGWPR